MKLWIFQRVPGITHNYHEAAGIVVVAESADQAREVLGNTPDPSAWGPEGNTFKTDELDFHKANALLTVNYDGPPKAWVFPDAGCC